MWKPASELIHKTPINVNENGDEDGAAEDDERDVKEDNAGGNDDHPGDEDHVEIQGQERGSRMEPSREGEVETEKIASAHSPKMPSPAEVEEHRLLHNPYRSWCKQCVMGGGTWNHHVRRDDSRREIAIVGWDYCFLTSK